MSKDEDFTYVKLLRLKQIVNELWYHRILNYLIPKDIIIPFDENKNYVPERVSKYKNPNNSAFTDKDIELVLLRLQIIDQCDIDELDKAAKG